MKRFSYKNLVTVLGNLCDRHLVFSKAVQNTFDEVYENLENLEKKIDGCEYSETDETLTVPTMLGTVADETLTLTY